MTKKSFDEVMAERAINSLGNRLLFSLLIAAAMCFMLTGLLMA